MHRPRILDSLTAALAARHFDRVPVTRMWTRILVVVGVFLAVAVPAGAAHALVNSPPASRQYPFIAELQYRKPVPGENFGHTCGATLIAPKWIVTAARCLYFGPDITPDTSWFRVRVGSNDRTAGGTVTDVSRFILHPDYLATIGGKADIALVQLARAVPYGVAPIGSRTPEGTSLRLLGWGGTCNPWPTCANNADFPIGLRQLDTQRTGAGRCAAADNFDRPTELCVDNPHRRGDCYGDSGGPALTQVYGGWQLAGIDSRGIGTTCGIQPSVYTDVSAYRGWLLRHIATGATRSGPASEFRVS
jgi:secreted trypsin-like serine protease